MEETINPAELETSSLLSLPTLDLPLEYKSRGIKRSRSPDAQDGTMTVGDNSNGDSKPRKRGRPFKSKQDESPRAGSQYSNEVPPSALQTPQSMPQSLPQGSPAQVSPPKSISAAKNVKQLPGARDHTTDQLSPEGDEYIPREIDEDGEKKVTATGHLMDGREYKCRTFFVPNRGDKLFMLATECARVLAYRDSYLLFTKNRSLYKIIASQAEKEDLISQEILPYSYRSRQIALVTAKSMYRQFGARLINNGRRVRDDYWESKAREKGFTEEDLATEKRPTVTKSKESNADASNANTNAFNILTSGEVVYAQGPSFDHHFEYLPEGDASAQGIPMVNPALVEDIQLRDYGNVQRPRQDMSGTPYQDRTQSSGPVELVNQAVQTAEFNKSLSQQRKIRGAYLEEAWRRKHEYESPPAAEQPKLEEDPTATQAFLSFQTPAQLRASVPAPPINKQPMLNMAQRQQAQSATVRMLESQNYQQYLHQQNTMAQSPARNLHQSVRPEQIYQHNPNAHMTGQTHAYGSAALNQAQSPAYTYQQSQMWPLQQTLSSPHIQQPYVSQYASHPQHHQTQHQSPHFHTQQSSPHNSLPPPLQHSHSAGSMQGNPMAYSNMTNTVASSGYGAMKGMYQQPSPGPQAYMQQSPSDQQAAMQGWMPPSSNHGQPGWTGH